MRRILFFSIAMVFMLGTTTAFSNDDGESLRSVEYADLITGAEELTAENMDLVLDRVEEIRDMDRSNLTGEARAEVKEELRKIKDLIQNKEPYIYIGGGTLLLIVILLILFL